VPALGAGHEVRRPRAQTGEGPKPRYITSMPYSPLGIIELMKREAKNWSAGPGKSAAFLEFSPRPTSGKEEARSMRAAMPIADCDSRVRDTLTYRRPSPDAYT
jgi:hypothetical protein